MAKQLESSRATTKHMKNQPTSQPKAQVNQLRHQIVHLSPHKKEGMKRKLLPKSVQSQAIHSIRAFSHLSKSHSGHHKYICGPRTVKTTCLTVPNVVIPGVDQDLTATHAGISIQIAKTWTFYK